MEGRPGDDARMQFWMRFRDGREADVLALPTLVDAAYPAVMEIGAAGSFTLELGATGTLVAQSRQLAMLPA
jgi:hypothetical protein